MNHQMIVAAIDAADISPGCYRTARRLLDMADDAGRVGMSYEALRAICGTDSDTTARSHLVKLHAVGILKYKRNAIIDVFFNVKVIPQRSNRAPGDHLDDGASTEVIPQRSNRALGDHLDDDASTEVIPQRSNRAPGDQIDPSAIKMIAEGSLRLALTTGWQAGQPSQPEPGEGAGGEPDATDDDGAPVTDQDRAVALLTDPEVGLADGVARELAAAFGFEEILRQTMRFVRDRAAGVVRSPAVLRRRLRDGYAATVTEQDRASPLFQRHVGEIDEAEERRRRYLPDELRDIIIG